MALQPVTTVNVQRDLNRVIPQLCQEPAWPDDQIEALLDSLAKNRMGPLSENVFGSSPSSSSFAFMPKVGFFLWQRLTPRQQLTLATTEGTFPHQPDQDALFLQAQSSLPISEQMEAAGAKLRKVAEYGRLDGVQFWLAQVQTLLANPSAGEAEDHALLTDDIGTAGHQAFVEGKQEVWQWLAAQPELGPVWVDRICTLLDQNDDATDIAQANAMTGSLALETLQAIEQRLQQDAPSTLLRMPTMQSRLLALQRQTEARQHDAPPSARRRLRP
jgi:hypothetical protein